jgi:hypothetical protein
MFFTNIIEEGASMVKWTTFDPYEGSTMKILKMHIKFEFHKILYKEL